MLEKNNIAFEKFVLKAGQSGVLSPLQFIRIMDNTIQATKNNFTIPIGYHRLRPMNCTPNERNTKTTNNRGTSIN